MCFDKIKIFLNRFYVGIKPLFYLILIAIIVVVTAITLTMSFPYFHYTLIFINSVSPVHIVDENLITIETYVNVIMATGTIAAVFVALFRKEIYSHFSRPKIVITKKSFDIQETEGHGRARFILTKWLGLTLINEGDSEAKNITVFFTGINSNVISNFHDYVSIPFVASWTNEIKLKSLQRKLPRRWDICSLREEDDWEYLDFILASIPNKLHVIEIRTGRPQRAFFIFKINIVADNFFSAYEVKLSCNGKYSDGIKVDYVKSL